MSETSIEYSFMTEEEEREYPLNNLNNAGNIQLLEPGQIMLVKNISDVIPRRIHKDSNMLKFQLINEHALIPTRSTPGSAGMDVYAIDAHMIKPGVSAKIPTGLIASFPPGHYLRVAPRSGLAVKHGINVHAGVIDSDFRGEIQVCLINHGQDIVYIGKGERIAQLILEKCWMGIPERVFDLDKTERGSGGFGSTGL